MNDEMKLTPTVLTRETMDYCTKYDIEVLEVHTYSNDLVSRKSKPMVRISLGVPNYRWTRSFRQDKALEEYELINATVCNLVAIHVINNT